MPLSKLSSLGRAIEFTVHVTYSKGRVLGCETVCVSTIGRLDLAGVLRLDRLQLAFGGCERAHPTAVLGRATVDHGEGWLLRGSWAIQVTGGH